MRRAARAKLVVLLAALSALAAACGKSESNDPSGDASSGAGSGGTNAVNGGGGPEDGPASTMCGGTLCEGLSLGVPGGPQTDACCPQDASGEACGVETGFLADYGIELMRECQPLNGPGEPDEACPDSPPFTLSSLSFSFPGCCLPSNKCGFFLDSVLSNAILLNLGCVDASELPNAEFGEPPDCGAPTVGQAGAAGAGGAR